MNQIEIINNIFIPTDLLSLYQDISNEFITVVPDSIKNSNQTHLITEENDESNGDS